MKECENCKEIKNGIFIDMFDNSYCLSCHNKYLKFLKKNNQKKYGAI
jgi:hypothetical protein